eukprot:CAMPEP_0198347234 /NCGR_PEP_ID=MMETSP1450-20131203/83732_1 /TAXON_ID=753684 ORGANISM="Madagascaria erythrocladiodes, Strain CCMP3234" /NCGR_SAMPLE_ID=MMETSP1450 /ASSEMBLY_ACC=CAM_ASM_001115 /LENGTH=219 /DNA_ID=CAMNT_0044052733 /DNA_START=36 /DNA_END=696 /DNA_ORIENTATION=-
MAFVNAVLHCGAVRRACAAVAPRSVGVRGVSVVPRGRAARAPSTRMQFDDFGEGEDASESPRESAPREVDSAKLFVGNLAWAVDDAELEDAFAPYGAVVEAKVIRDRESGRSRGFGFITYEETGAVEEALAAMDGAELLGRSIRVNKADQSPATSAAVVAGMVVGVAVVMETAVDMVATALRTTDIKLWDALQWGGGQGHGLGVSRRVGLLLHLGRHRG